MNIILLLTKYRFLLKQLVLREFKTKYKRSVLGVFWSFLNPLLMMLVQYAVFMNLFRFEVENYAIYLLSGIILFNFFSEASSQSMGSILGNASLITKVYVPKYIFPVSKVLSSTINLTLSIFPLIIVMIFSGIQMTWAIVLLPFGLACMIIFSIGTALILSSAMVFFRDTQFLWGVIVTAWMYATPIIYPESILTPTMMFIMKFNPLYHFIRFNRIILLQGVSPEPKAYVFCVVFAMIMLILGVGVFRKTQDKFIFNI